MTKPLPMEPPWLVEDRFLELRSAWMTLIGEHLRDNQGKRLDYWRIETADSAIVIPLHGNRILLPYPTYRPGLGQSTLDFPGGRVPSGSSPAEAALASLERELGIARADLRQLLPLNQHGWAVNSSSSNQKLYGFVADIPVTTPISSEVLALAYPTTSTGMKQLHKALTCLQCRALFLEWWSYSTAQVPPQNEAGAN